MVSLINSKISKKLFQERLDLPSQWVFRIHLNTSLVGRSRTLETRSSNSPEEKKGKTDLDFLLVVVDLPGNVNMHRTPLPWFLTQERATWSEGSPFRENRLQFPQSFSAAFGCRGFFHRSALYPLSAFCQQLSSAQAWRCHSQRLLPPCGSQSWRLPLRKPHLTRTSPVTKDKMAKARSPLCFSSLFLFWCQLADLVEWGALLNKRPCYNANRLFKRAN